MIGAKIIRKGKIINLSAPSLSGTLLHHALLVLATQPFFATIPAADLTLNGSPVSEIRDEFLPRVETSSEGAKTAALLVRIELQESQEEIVPPVEQEQKVHSPVSLYLRRPNFQLPRNLPNRKVLYLLLLVFVFLFSFIVFPLRSQSLEQQNAIVHTL